MGIGYNINDRNNYEQQLLTQRALQERIFSESTLAMLIVNSNYRYVNANNEFYKLFGVTWNQIADIDLSDPTNYTENNIMLIDMMKDVFAGKTIEFEMPVRDVFVGFFNVHVERALELNCKMAPITNSDGKIENIIVYLHDITAYKTTVRQLRETQLIYSTVTSNFREGILILLDVNLLYRLVEGDKDLSMLGKNKSQMLGTSIYEDANLFGTTFITYAENALKRESFNFEISSIAKKEDGSEFEIYYNVTFTPIINEKDEVSFVYISLINVTDRKLFEQNILEFNSKLDKEVESRTEQLQKATLALEANYSELQLTQLQLVETQKDLAASLKKEKDLNDMKSQFIALISHEYRTPLTIIHTYIYLLETFYDVQNKDKFLKGIGVISQAVEAMTKLLDNALFLNEYQNHQIELTSISINEFLRSIIESSIDTHKATQKMDVITIRDNIIIDTDKYLLKQIIGNILSNAIKYSSASSVIRIELVDTDDDYTISIQDSGKGIGEDVRGNVFDSFVRSKDVTNISGSGLGLFIVKNCVNMLQGDVSFVTKTNVGTIFTTTFPKKLKNIHNS